MSDVRTVELKSVRQRQYFQRHSCNGLELLDCQMSIEDVFLVSLLVESGYQYTSVSLLDRVLVGLDQSKSQLLN